MNYKFVCLVLASTLLSACGKTEAPVQPATDPVEAVEPAAASPAVPNAAPKGDAVLVGGYLPTFPHKVRSMRNEGDSHFVVVEYLGVDRDAVITTLSNSLKSEGFEVAGPQPVEAAVQYVYTDADGRRMIAIFNDPSSRPMVNPGANGIVQFIWTDKSEN